MRADNDLAISLPVLFRSVIFLLLFDQFAVVSLEQDNNLVYSCI